MTTSPVGARERLESFAASLELGGFGMSMSEDQMLSHAADIRAVLAGDSSSVVSRDARTSPTGSDAWQRGFYRGVSACIAWLHERANGMNDSHAKAVLNSAAYALGADKPCSPVPCSSQSGEPRSMDQSPDKRGQ